MIKPFYVSIACALIFFIISFLTLPDYGTSWDETLHFSRGQAYLHFFLTGSKDYSNLSVPRRSFYQFDYHSGDFWFKDNGGHPPVSDILAALSNYIFYQRLGILSDVHSYHLFNILASSFLVWIVVFFAVSTFGKFAGLVSFLTLTTYPLFFSEAHFNVKDPALSAFFSATILFFYLALVQKSRMKLFVSFIFFALGLGTKLNILFLPIIIGLYLFFYKKTGNVVKFPKSFWIVCLIGGIFTVTLFIASWPFLWDNFPQNLLKVFNFYKQIGTGTAYQPNEFFIFGFNSFPLLWILFTTPPVVIILLVVSIISAFINRNLKNGVSILWLLWLAIPIARVTFPGTSIYGGVRQIMEFLPALALLSGLGAWQILEWTKKFNKQTLVIMILILIFIWPTYVLFKMHPNENVYFNSLIGGLKGAEEKNFPSWGNSYGNAYFQGVGWINRNAPLNTKVSLIQGIEVNTPDILYRPDINLNNENWSGIERKGEYLMELTFNDTGKAFHYTWEYVDKFLIPVYQLEVDGVAILKIWVNDLEHTKPEYRMVEERLKDPVKFSKEGSRIKLDLGKLTTVSRINLNFTNSEDCSPVGTSIVETSLNNQTWIREGDWIPFPQVSKRSNLDVNTISFHFAARDARFIRFLLDSDKSCLLQEPNFQIYIL